VTFTSTSPASTRRLTRAAIVLALALAVVVWHNWGSVWLDLRVYRAGAQVWLDGGDFYQNFPPETHLELPFTYPPLAALFFVPLALMPMLLAAAAVLMTSLACLGMTLWLVIGRIRPSLNEADRLALTFVCTAVALFLEPVQATLSFGQVNLVLMAAVALDCLSTKTAWPRGLLIGIAAAIKLTPAGFLLYFLIRKDWKAAATVLGSAAGALTVTYLIFPARCEQYFFHLMLNADRVGSGQFPGNQSLKGVVLRLHLSSARDHGASTLVWMLLCAGALVLAALWMRRLFAVGESTTALTVNAAAILLVSPISWTHHWVWTAPAFLVAVSWAVRGADPSRLTRADSWNTRTALLLGPAAVFFIGIPWLLPNGNDREWDWTWWQQLLGNSYAVVALGALIVAAGAKSVSKWPPQSRKESAEAIHA
jgi:alpha-1,2-mannosyltransferase